MWTWAPSPTPWWTEGSPEGWGFHQAGSYRCGVGILALSFSYEEICGVVGARWNQPPPLVLGFAGRSLGPGGLGGWGQRQRRFAQTHPAGERLPGAHPFAGVAGRAPGLFQRRGLAGRHPGPVQQLGHPGNHSGRRCVHLVRALRSIVQPVQQKPGPGVAHADWAHAPIGLGCVAQIHGQFQAHARPGWQTHWRHGTRFPSQALRGLRHGLGRG